MVHDNDPATAPRSFDSAGSATLTTDPSMKATLDPRMVAASVARGWATGCARTFAFIRDLRAPCRVGRQRHPASATRARWMRADAGATRRRAPALTVR